MIYRICLVAGEASGDVLGADLMTQLQKELEIDGHKVVFSGVGGEQMQKGGFKSLFPIENLSVMGLSALLFRLPALLYKIRQTAEYIARMDPHCVVMIDSPDFTHRVARRLTRLLSKTTPVIDYVTPSVWAWRAGRAYKMVKYFSEGMCILPFEPDFFKNHGGLKVAYVGHPLVRLFDDHVSIRCVKTWKESRCIFLVLPGSRKKEVDYILPIFIKTIDRLYKMIPQIMNSLSILIPTKCSVLSVVQHHLAQCSFPYKIVLGEEEKHYAMKCARVALAASGTVTIELSFCGVPTVVGYKISKLDFFLAKKFVKVSYVSIINICMKKEIFPELLQNNCRQELLANNIISILEDDEKIDYMLRNMRHFSLYMKEKVECKPYNIIKRLLYCGTKER